MMGALRQVRWLAYAVVLLIVYSAVLPPSSTKLPDGVLTIFQAHRVAGEDFLQSTQRHDAVLVGSSLSAVLPQIGLQPIYNLAMSGGSALTGMRLVGSSKEAPRLVFIEANVLSRPADETLLAELNSPFQRWLKKWCAACRTRNQPVTVALSYLSWLRLKPVDAQEEDRVSLASPRTPASTREMLSIQREASSQPVDPILMKKSLDQIGPLVDALQRAGTQVIFVEMPMHPDIAAAAHNRSTLAAVKARFPSGPYVWLQFADREYQTSDGSHLLYGDARAVARTLAMRAGANPG